MMKKKWAVILMCMASVLAMPVAHAEGEVARSIITSAVIEREPVDDLEIVPASNETVMFFTDLRGMQGQTIKHVWMHGDEQIAEVSFDVGGPRWRVWSSKSMMPEWTGSWTVQVVNGVGGVMAEKSFTYGMADDAGMQMGTEGQAPMSGEQPMTEEAPMTGEPPMGEEAPMGEQAPAAEETGGPGMTE